MNLIHQTRRRFVFVAAGCALAGCMWTSASVPAAEGDKGESEKPADEPKPDVVVDEKSAGKTVKAKVGDVIEFRLKGEKEHTGWGGGAQPHVGAKIKPPVLERGKDGFEAAPDAKESAIGTYIFHAKAYEKGSVEVTFRYIYPGGHGHELEARLATQVVREMKITIEVG